MTRNWIWIVAAVAVLGLAVISVLLGNNLVPSHDEALQRGTVAGWWLIWTVIAITVLVAVGLAAFLVAAGMGRLPETRSARSH